MGKSRTQIIVHSVDKNPMDRNVMESINADHSRAIKVIDEYDWDLGMGSPTLFIQNEVIQPLKYFVERAYAPVSVDDFKLAYKGFCDIIFAINQHAIYTPTVIDFCRYVNMSKRRYDQLREQNDEIGEVVSQIHDFLSNNVMQNMLTGRTREISSIFILKASFGLRDSEPVNNNVVNFNVQTKSTEQILQELEKLGL